MICPECNGQGMFEASIKGELRLLDCHRCLGSGIVLDEMADWIKVGVDMRAKRLANQRTLREEAAVLNISPTKLSQMERGMIKPEVMR